MGKYWYSHKFGLGGAYSLTQKEVEQLASNRGEQSQTAILALQPGETWKGFNESLTRLS